MSIVFEILAVVLCEYAMNLATKMSLTVRGFADRIDNSACARALSMQQPHWLPLSLSLSLAPN